MDRPPSAPRSSPPEPAPRYPMFAIRGISGAIILVMVLFFMNAPDRDAILGGRPSSLDDLILAVAAHTFPLALGCFLMVFIAHRLSDANVNVPPPVWIGGAGMILYVSGLFAQELGYRRLPVMQAFKFDGYYSIASSAFGAYLTGYGWPLLICGVTAGVYLGIELESHM